MGRDAEGIHLYSFTQPGSPKSRILVGWTSREGPVTWRQNDVPTGTMLNYFGKPAGVVENGQITLNGDFVYILPATHTKLKMLR